MATNNKPKTTRIVCISDTHNRYDFPIPDGDILIHAGDFSNTGTQIEIENFLEYLKSLKQYRLKIVIAGNHDITLDPDFYEKSWAKWHGSRKQNYQKIRLLMYDPVLRVNYGIIYLEQEDYIDRQTGLKFYGR
jgi:3',5'-cyclic AMP phosphodiesterase CpdA